MPSIKAGEAYVELYADKSGLRKDLGSAKQDVEKWAAATGRANKATFESNKKFTDLASTAIRLEMAVNVAKTAVIAMGAVTAAMRGEWEQVETLIKKLPMGLGEMASLTDEVLSNITGAAAKLANFKNEVKGISQYVKGMEVIGNIRSGAEERAQRAGRTDEQNAIADLNKKLAEQVALVQNSPGSKLAKEKAIKALNNAYFADYIAMGKKIEAPILKKIADEKAAALKKEEDLQREIDNNEYDSTLVAAQEKYDKEQKAIQDEEDLQREIDNNEYNSILAAADEAEAVALAAVKDMQVRETRGVTGASAAGIQSLQTAPAMDRVAQATELTAKNTRKLVEQGGPKYN